MMPLHAIRQLACITIGVLAVLFAVPRLAISAETAPTPASNAVSVVATASKTEVTVGETFLVTVIASGPAGTTWSFPVEAGDERVELRSPVPGATDASPLPANAREYEAAAYALGDVQVPPIRLTYRRLDGTEGTALTEAVPLRIVSLLPRDTKEQTLADIRGPVGLAIGRAFWVMIGVAVALILATSYWLFRRRARSEQPRLIAPALSPNAEALQALDHLAASDLLTRGEHRAFYIALTEVVKRYLERRLSAPVLEMTSAEMLAFLRDHAQASRVMPAARDLATAADAIKFARGRGVTEEALRHIAAARDLVRALEAQIHLTTIRAGAEEIASRVAI